MAEVSDRVAGVGALEPQIAMHSDDQLAFGPQCLQAAQVIMPVAVQEHDMKCLVNSLQCSRHTRSHSL